MTALNIKRVSPSQTRSFLLRAFTVVRHSDQVYSPVRRVHKHKILYNLHRFREITKSNTSSSFLPPLISSHLMSVIDPKAAAKSESDGGSRECSNHGVESVDENADVGAVENLERKILPEEFSRSVIKLTCQTSTGGECDVYLVGTNHVSKESCHEVKAVISFLKPQVVFLELCASRVATLFPQDIKVPTMREMIDQWKKKKKNAFGILYSWFIAKVASQLDVFPGSEFRVAYDEAKQYGGKVILGDRPVHITLERTWATMPLRHKMKLLYFLLFPAIHLPGLRDLNRILKEMDDMDKLTLVIQELSKKFPTVMETLVHERDKFMSSRLLEIAHEHTSVVAVVGKGHLQGIKKHWKQPVKLNDLLAMPPKKGGFSTVKIMQTLGVTVAGVAILSGLYLLRKK